MTNATLAHEIVDALDTRAYALRTRADAALDLANELGMVSDPHYRRWIELTNRAAELDRAAQTARAMILYAETHERS